MGARIDFKIGDKVKLNRGAGANYSSYYVKDKAYIVEARDDSDHSRGGVVYCEIRRNGRLTADSQYFELAYITRRGGE